jgi:ABC-type enterochelin transport system permease subunit
MPFRWIAIAQGVVAWSVLGVLDQALHRWIVPTPPGTMMLAGLGMLLGAAFAVQISEAARTWALKPGRSVAEVAPFLRVLQLVGGFLFAVFAFRMLF